MNPPLFWRLYFTKEAIKRSLFRSGWLRSIWTGKARDVLGQPIPSWSYPALHFVNGLDLTGVRVFEYGSGASTVYWRNRYSHEIRSYTAVETNEAVFKHYSAKDGFYRDNVHLYPAGDPAGRFASIEELLFNPNRPFDFTVVSGEFLHRHFELEHSLAITDSLGVILVDDVQWFPNFIEQFCADHRFYRLDFVGVAPGIPYPKITSLLFKEPLRFQAAKVLVPEESAACPFLPV